jgi:hypothetical protein
MSSPVSPIQSLQNSYDRLVAPESYGTRHTGNPYIDAGLTTLSDLGAGLLNVGQPIMHPLKTLKSVADVGMAASGNPSLSFPAQQRLVAPYVPQPNESGKQYAQRLGGMAVTAIPPIALGATRAIPEPEPAPYSLFDLAKSRGVGTGDSLADFAAKMGLSQEYAMPKPTNIVPFGTLDTHPEVDLGDVSRIPGADQVYDQIQKLNDPYKGLKLVSGANPKTPAPLTPKPLAKVIPFKKPDGE